MVAETIAKFNFLDFIVIILFLRICYMAAKMGLSIEIFKFLGVIFSIYIGLHYYTTLSDIIQKSFRPKEMPLEFMDFIVYLLLICAGYLAFVGLRSLLFRFVQLNALPRINQIAGLLLGIGRGFLVVGMLSFTLAISSVTYLSDAVKHSSLASKTIMILPQTYGWLWDNLVSKFSPREKLNPTVAEALDKFSRP